MPIGRVYDRPSMHFTLLEAAAVALSHPQQAGTGLLMVWSQTVQQSDRLMPDRSIHSGDEKIHLWIDALGDGSRHGRQRRVQQEPSENMIWRQQTPWTESVFKNVLRLAF